MYSTLLLFVGLKFDHESLHTAKLAHSAWILLCSIYSKRTKVFVHRQISMYRLCHLSTKESVEIQDGN